MSSSFEVDMRLLLCIALLPSIASAQLSSISPDSRVRGVFPSVIPEPIHAVFVVASSDSLWLRNANGYTTGGVYNAPRLAVRISDIVSLDVRAGRDHQMGAVRGFFVGALASGVLFAASSKSEEEDTQFSALLLSPVVVLVSTIVGSTVGVEQWRPVIAPPPRP